MATRRAKPAPASHAEKANSSIGVDAKEVALVWRAQMARSRKRDNISPSRHRRADRRWFR